MIEVIKPEQASEILKAHGYKSATPIKIRQGLIQGLFPFGQAIQMSSNTVYDIYLELLMKWIAERDSDNAKEKAPD